ncbi:hypothetical protein KC19_VG144000 [Ceratodon purpureus]|uniref:Uncharacterized protein n=1 Tax=Ceratodon purpureus TaxID=3225 RepID=A0A8T0HQH8_CERPU|nr:hypothetical protein KC19_VG144000 [Ceratodon purpureus]
MSRSTRAAPVFFSHVPLTRPFCDLIFLLMVSHMKNVLLECREFSCFCEGCLRVVGGECLNQTHTEPWRLVTLEPVDLAQAVQEPEEPDPQWEQASNENFLASQFSVGDHFAVLADPHAPRSGGASFFVLMCTKPLHVVQEETVTDAWGSVLDRCDEVVEGIYYHQHGRKDNSYVFLREAGPALLLSHLVCATKFSMTMANHKQKGGVSLFHLSDSALTHIREVVKASVAREELDSEVDLDNSDSDVESTDNNESESKAEESSGEGSESS